MSTSSAGPGKPGAATTRFQEPGWKRFAFCLVVLVAVMSPSLVALGRLAWAEDLHSHVFLVPLVSLYVVWTERRRLPAPGRPAWGAVAGFGVLAAASFAVGTGLVGGAGVEADVRLALRILGLWLTVGAMVAGFLGGAVLRFTGFALGFTVFSVPLPEVVVQGMETGLKLASAEVAHWMMLATRMPVLRDGVFFRLPGLTIEVAQECSGIRSSWVLLIVGVLAARLFLVRPWKRFLLVLLVLPLGVVRNAFRIWTLSYLTVNVDPDVIHSWIHHRGGPIFFALSLIPFSALLWLLTRSEGPLSAHEGEPVPSKTLSKKA